MRYGNIEFRWSEQNQSHELVKWQGISSCYVIAFFDKGKEHYNMRTIGERFFEDDKAWLVGKHALSFLNHCFEDEISNE